MVIAFCSNRQVGLKKTKLTLIFRAQINKSYLIRRNPCCLPPSWFSQSLCYRKKFVSSQTTGWSSHIKNFYRLVNRSFNLLLSSGEMIFKALDPRVICAMLTLCFRDISRWVNCPSSIDLIIVNLLAKVSFSYLF